MPGRTRQRYGAIAPVVAFCAGTLVLAKTWCRRLFPGIVARSEHLSEPADAPTARERIPAINADNQNHAHAGTPASKPVILAIVILLLFYAVATGLGFTQPGDGHGEGHSETAAAHATPDYYAVMPFVLLLGAIALLPLLSATEHWWESNRNRFLVAGGLAIATIAYYVLLYDHAGFGKAGSVLEHAVLKEYIPFIVLLFSLYTISGGIRISGDLAAHPLTNSTFIAVGGLLASFIGTTGAAMLLIRPLLETNSERRHVQHTVVFFIFVVCNCGGCLLPIGDPPLFLGYLLGVDFLWTMWNLWLPWLVVNIALIGVYYLWDRFFCYPKEKIRDIRRDETRIRPLKITGLWPNVLLLIGIVFSVALLDPTKAFPGTEYLVDGGWHPWLFLREIVQLGLVALSLGLGCHKIREDNKFNYHAIVEVAVLFIGIFICMQPAIEILNEKGADLGLETPRQMFWATGGLSAVLDNAPTYVVFFKTAAASNGGDDFPRLVSEPGRPADLLVGIALGAVFMGAMTYIGNGPNFMVRAIAEQSGIRMPSFFGYVIKYSVPILLPIFFIATLLFL